MILSLFIALNALASTSDFLHFQRLTPENGLPREQVNCLFQDSRGFLWIGTSDGLARYDSHEFRIFRPDKADPHSLIDRHVSDIKEDKEGNLWMATFGGLAFWHRKTEQFTHFRNNPTNSNSLSGNQIWCLLMDPDGSLWMGTSDSGLNHFFPQTGKFEWHMPVPGQEGSLNDGSIQCLFRDRKGQIWIGTSNGGLNQLDPQTGRFHVYTHNPNDSRSLCDNHVSAIAEDAEGFLWIGTANGISRLDPDRRYFEPFIADKTNAHALQSQIIDAILVDRENNVWVGTDGGGLSRYHAAARTFIHYRHSKYITHTLASDVVRTIFQDRTGDYWVGHFPAGISHVNRLASSFHQVCSMPGETNTLSDDHVMSFLEEPSGGLWIGTDNGGLNYWDPVANKWTHYRHDLNNPQSLGAKAALCLLRDHRGQIWVGTWGGGLNCLDPKTGAFRRYMPDSNRTNTIGHPHIWRLLEDRQNQIWIATSGGGLDCYHPDKDLFIHHRRIPSNRRSLNSDHVSCLLLTRNGNFWVGTTEGLARWAPATGDWDRFQSQSDTPGSLSSNDIIDMAEDRHGQIWITTGGGGLNCFNPNTGRFEYFRAADGLPSDVLRGIIEDDDGILWISSNHGLTRFDPNTRRVINYEENDGLPGREFSPNGRLKLRSGELVWGTTQGFVKFDPRSIQINTNPPPVVLTSFEIFNQPVQPGLPESPLRLSITETRRLEIPSRISMLSFQFAALNYRSSERNQYRFMLDGFDGTWRKTGPERRATFTNLDPGSYRLRVKASNGDNIWNEEELCMELVIIPPWWRTWWFRGAVALTLLGTVATAGWSISAHRFRTRILESERERKIAREREQAGLVLQQANRALRTLSECNQALVRARDEAALLNDLCRILIGHGGYRMAWIGYAEKDEGRSVRPVAQAGVEDGYLATLKISWGDNERGQGPTGIAIRTGQPSAVRNILTDPNYVPWREEARKRGYASSLALPLKMDEQVLGALNIYSAKPDAFDNDELVLLTELANDLVYGIMALRINVARKCAEVKLAENHTLLEKAQEVAHLGGWSSSLSEESTLIWSSEIFRIFGLNEAQFDGKVATFYMLVHPEDRDLVRNASRRAAQQGVDYEIEHRIIRPDGVLRWVYEKAEVIRDSSGKPLRLVGVVQDITERKQAEDVLRRSEEQFRLIMENLADLVAVLDLDGHRLYNSPSYQGILGDVNKLRGSSSFDQIHPEDRGRVQQVFQETVRTGVGQRMEYRLMDQNGNIRYIESQGSVVRDSQGKVSQVLVVSRDETSRKQAEEQIEASEQKYRELVEHANSIILRWTPEGRILFLNEFGQRFFGYTELEICGKHVLGTIVPETESSGRNLPSLMEQICANPAAFQQNVNENIRRNGDRVWIAWTNKVVLNPQGQMAEILSIGLDITARKRMEEELRETQASLEHRVAERTIELAVAKDRAEAADRLKSAFLATMSHELRTPLNSIIGFTGILLQGLAGALNSEQHKQLEMVRDSARHLLALINDVLDISKIEAGQLKVVHEPFDLHGSIEKSVKLVNPLALKKGLALRVEVAPEIRIANGDQRRVEQILINLMNNAIKFTVQGEVTLKAMCQDAIQKNTGDAPSKSGPPHYQDIYISVHDTGIGIKPEDLTTLFQPFRQLDYGLARNHEGTGLGLAICRRLAELMGGEIRAESEFGKGSVFTFRLPGTTRNQ